MQAAPPTVTGILDGKSNLMLRILAGKSVGVPEISKFTTVEAPPILLSVVVTTDIADQVNLTRQCKVKKC